MGNPVENKNLRSHFGQERVASKIRAMFLSGDGGGVEDMMGNVSCLVILVHMCTLQLRFFSKEASKSNPPLL